MSLIADERKQVMGMLLNRTWQVRRVVVTKDVIAFAFLGEEAQIDHIPFAEVTHVKEMAEAASDEYDAEDQQFSYAMQIATREDGYNSGRIYYLSTGSKEMLDELIAFLAHRAQLARTHAEASTWFRKIQLKIRAKYNSRAFQSLMAVLIIAVRNVCLPFFLLLQRGKIRQASRSILASFARIWQHSSSRFKIFFWLGIAH